ncbi:Inner membrane protein YpjD [Usitatibacter rugosus]|uniref:Inner membrane protein YpjD n=1 Tax=Usitatibacter rugosus TaxID=2732067 RepID=A0A6M4H006_9PROT|nr:cytochrome c biogenesis protein CcsA [Usitatibacter rugosus]QJR12820.1 Inner membrane protein YpjD [Usitatibacter rugosus]
MPDLLLYFSTAGLWLALSALAWRATRPAVAGGPAPGPDVRLENLLVPVALVLHAMLLHRGIVVTEGLNLGVANAVSLLVWLTALIYWLAGLAYPGLSGMQGLMAPIALAAVVLQGAVPSRHIVTYTAEPLFTLHFAIAMLAYALVIVATVHALVMLAEEKWLHRGVMPPFIKALPPLLEMEALLFRILLAAFILLTLTVVSGVFFSELLFNKPLTFTHKNVFAILSWLIFGGLLAGHHLRGWRGRKAVRWTLAGFFMLLLAYVGSKFVFEIVLQR